MAKIITAPPERPASQVKLDADVPTQANMVVSGNTVQCSNIQMSQIKTLLGSTDPNWNKLSQLNRSPLINQWSYFKPGKLGRNSTNGEFAQVVYVEDTEPYDLGDWAGYDHNASSPLFTSSVTQVFQQAGANTLSGITIQMGGFVPEEVVEGTGVTINQFRIKLEANGLATTYQNIAYTPTSTEFTIPDITVQVPTYPTQRVYRMTIYMAAGDGSPWYLFPYNDGSLFIYVSQVAPTVMYAILLPRSTEPTVYYLDQSPFFDPDGYIEAYQGEMNPNNDFVSGTAFSFQFRVRGNVSGYTQNGYRQFSGTCDIGYYIQGNPQSVTAVQSNVPFRIPEQGDWSDTVSGNFSGSANAGNARFVMYNIDFTAISSNEV